MPVPSRLRKRPTQERSRLTVDAILEAADRLLRQQSYEAASTNRIARVAGFSVGSLYQYFDDKQAVVGSLIDRALEEEARGLVTAAQDGASSERVSYLVALIDHLLEQRKEARHLYRVLWDFESELACTPALEHIIQVQAPVAAEALQRLTAPRLAGGGRPVDALLFAVTRWVHAAAFHFAVEQPAHLAPEAIRDEIVAAVEHQLRGGCGGAHPEVDALVQTWVTDLAASPRPPSRSRTLRAVRSHVLSTAAEPPKDPEPRIFVAACLADVVWHAIHYPPSGADSDQLTEEVRRLAASVLERENG